MSRQVMMIELRRQSLVYKKVQTGEVGEGERFEKRIG